MGGSSSWMTSTVPAGSWRPLNEITAEDRDLVVTAASGVCIHIHHDRRAHLRRRPGFFRAGTFRPKPEAAPLSRRAYSAGAGEPFLAASPLAAAPDCAS